MSLLGGVPSYMSSADRRLCPSPASERTSPERIGDAERAAFVAHMVGESTRSRDLVRGEVGPVGRAHLDLVRGEEVRALAGECYHEPVCRMADDGLPSCGWRWPGDGAEPDLGPAGWRSEGRRRS